MTTVYSPLVRTAQLIAFVLMAIPCFARIPKLIKKDKPPEPTALDRYIEEATRNSTGSVEPVSSPGSIWTPASRLPALGSALRARQVDDMVTVLVAEHASAPSKGVTKTQRQSSATRSIGGLA